MYVPLVKGTADENERVCLPERVIIFIVSNVLPPVVNVVNLGRSNEMNQINQTSHIQ